MNLRFTLAIYYLFACGSSALAQYGVSNQRDMYGNIVRDTGSYTSRAVNQGPINSAPAQPPTSNSRMNTGSSK
jgi:hypothetical protein